MNSVRIVSHLRKPIQLVVSGTLKQTRAAIHTSVYERSLYTKGNICTAKPQYTWCVCSYAKKAGKDKKGKAAKVAKVQLTQEEIGDILNLESVKQEMQGVLDRLKESYIHSLNVRTSVGSFDRVVVETSDGRFHLNQLGQIAQKNPQMIMINLAAVPQHIKDVKKALEKSGLDVNPQQEGTTLFIPIPKVTREHRENLAKSAKKLLDQSKTLLNSQYQKLTKKVNSHKDKKGISEDLIKNLNNMLLDMTHEYSAEAEKLLETKKKELLG